MAKDERRWQRYFDADTITRLCHIGFKPKGLVEGNLVGNHRSPFHGFAIEFAGHRQYVPGDDLKHLDWRAYSRTEKFLIKQYEEETNFNAHLVIDISRSMSFEHEHGSKLDYAAFISVALGQLVINQSDMVGAFLFDNKIKETVRTSNSQEVIEKIVDNFQHSEEKTHDSCGDVLCSLAERIGRRQIVFIISDFLNDVEDTFRGIKRLMDDKNEVILFHVVDPLEMNFDIPGRVRLYDLEGDEHLDFTGHTVSDSFNEIFGEYLESMKSESLKLGVDYIQCSMDKEFGFHLAEYFSKRMLL